MTIDEFLAHFDGVKKHGAGWRMLCPAHRDTDPSLDVDLGDDGRRLVICRAKCTTAAILAAAGLKPSDLFSDRPARPAGSKPATKPKTFFPTTDDALRYFGRGKPDRTSEYPGGVALVYRWEPRRPGEKKAVRAIFRIAGGWTTEVQEPIPLYRLSDLPDGETTVLVVEGEGVADAAAGLGLSAVTSLGGSGRASSTDWSPMAGRTTVAIFPDRDTAGEDFATDVIGLLSALEPRPAVKVVRLPGLAEHGDLVDYLRDHPATTGDDILRMVDAAAPADLPAPATEAATATAGETLGTLLADLGGKIRRGEPVVRALPCGLGLLDKYMGGLPRGELTGLVGSPGCGKSTLADAMVCSILEADPDAVGLVFNLETSSPVRAARLLASRSVEAGEYGEILRSCPVGAILRGTLRDLESAQRAIERLQPVAARLRFLPDCRTASGVADVIRNERPAVAVVDHAGLLTADVGTGTNEVAVFDASLAAVLDATREADCATVVIGELSKSALLTGDVGMGAVRGSARFASLAGAFLVLAHDPDGDGDGELHGPAGWATGLACYLVKSRYGQSGIVQRARFLGGLAMFNWSEPEPNRKRPRNDKGKDASD